MRINKGKYDHFIKSEMTDLLDLLVFQSIFSWMLIFITIMMIVVMPRLFGLNYITALVYPQFTLFFNATTIIAGLDSDAVSIDRGFHFYIIEFSFLALTFAVYRYLLVHRINIIVSMQNLFSGKGAVFVTISLVALTVFNYLMVPTDGSSRIAYMTEEWFSLIKPFIQLATPLAYLGVFLMLQSSRRLFLGCILLATVVVANIATGSKASFAIGLLTAFLALRDLTGSAQLVISRGILIKLVLFVGAAVVLALVRLDVSIADIVDRFFLYGEATILTYFSETPTAACANLSTFASMHRGWARLLGDSSAQNIDTLFGYALNIERLGVNTFTGPNGRLSAYFLCNFPSERILFGIFVVFIYLCLILFLFKIFLTHPNYLALLYPFLLYSLGGAAQDFNLIMQDITILSILLISTVYFHAKPARCQLE